MTQHNSIPSILCVGEDPDLLSTRALLLRSLGADVQWVTNVSEAERSLAEKNFALIILCHSVKRTDGAAISSAAREHAPSTMVLQITNCFESEEDQGHICCDALVDAHPASFTDCVREILRRRAAQESRRHWLQLSA